MKDVHGLNSVEQLFGRQFLCMFDALSLSLGLALTLFIFFFAALFIGDFSWSVLSADDVWQWWWHLLINNFLAQRPYFKRNENATHLINNNRLRFDFFFGLSCLEYDLAEGKRFKNHRNDIWNCEHVWWLPESSRFSSKKCVKQTEREKKNDTPFRMLIR